MLPSWETSFYLSTQKGAYQQKIFAHVTDPSCVWKQYTLRYSTFFAQISHCSMKDCSNTSWSYSTSTFTDSEPTSMSTRTFSDSRHYYHHREKSTTCVFHHFLPQNFLPHRLLQAKRQLQSVCLKKLFVCQYFFRIPVADNPSAGHQNHAIAGFQNHIEIMRCDDFQMFKIVQYMN